MSIQTDDSTNASISEDAAVEALIKSFGAPAGDADSEDQDDVDEGADPDEDEDEADEAPEDPDDAEDGDEAAEDDVDDEAEDESGTSAVTEAPDDAIVRFTVDGETQEVTVASLKRLAGQEASLTRKSQEADLVGGRAAAALQAAIEATVEDLQPYAEVDWLVLQQQMEPEEFQWHRANASRHEARYRKLVEQAQGFEQTIQERRKAEVARRAEEANAILSNPETGIPGWGDQLRGEILSFGASQGLDAGDLENITDPAVLKLLNMAMLYSRGQKAVAQKVNPTPKKVLKAAKRDSGAEQTVNVKKAQQRLAQSGSDEDAVALLKGRWG